MIRDLLHSLPIVDFLATGRAFVERQSGNRIGLTTGLAGPIPLDLLDLLTVTGWAYGDFHHHTDLLLESFLGREEKIVYLLASFTHEFAFGINGYAVQVRALNDIQILFSFTERAL
jgi:hypothetical protein